MNEAIEETNRRRSIQQAYNDENGIVPMTIIKPIRPPLHNAEDESLSNARTSTKGMTKKELQRQIDQVEREMKKAAKEYDFERAAELRDILFELKAELAG
jgi:excinuclease ABC subunit B